MPSPRTVASSIEEALLLFSPSSLGVPCTPGSFTASCHTDWQLPNYHEATVLTGAGMSALLLLKLQCPTQGLSVSLSWLSLK